VIALPVIVLLAAAGAGDDAAQARALLKEEHKILDVLDDLDRQVAALSSEIRSARDQLEPLEKERQILGVQIGTLTERLTARRSALQRRLRARLRSDETGNLRLLLNARDPTDLVRRRYYLARLLRHDLDLLRGLRDDRGLLERAYADRERAAADIAAITDELERRRGELEARRSVKRAIRRQVRKERGLLRALERQRAARRAALDAPLDAASPSFMAGASGIETRRGRLPHPASGRVTRGFGRHQDPELGTLTQSKGIEINAALGAPVRAVYAGQVVYSGWYKGFGNLIIIRHEPDYYTLYAHLSAIAKARGETVEQGERIGEVGDTGSLRGPMLYFELRKRSRPLNPARWLRRGK